ncbi:MAG: radical SAM family heme chaperone HemW [Gemmatimonadota bacterium]|nr:radical SAM family heme chaperone HemW [Gemmatimonadota bacterium]
MTPRHLYIHVPFCGRRCVYCDFSIAVRREVPVAEYLAALRAELDRTAPRESWILDTVYLGGGTPSRLGSAGLASVLDLVRERATIADSAEVTIEANPEDVNPPDAQAWREAGINRVSLGVQSFNDDVLRWMHRNHTGADATKAVGMLRDAGIDNISIDLIFSLPASLNRSWSDDLSKAIALNPPHISVYGLTVEPKTPLARWVSAGTVLPGAEDPYADEFLEADASLAAAGYNHYEVSNYARDGIVSRHNSSYWTGAEYLGVGPSAHSLIGDERRWNVRPYEEWKDRLLAGEGGEDGFERLTAEARLLESIYLGLRTSSGFRARASDAGRITRWVDAGWGSMSGDTVTLNASGWLRLDALAADLGGAEAGRNYISTYGSPAA